MSSQQQQLLDQPADPTPTPEPLTACSKPLKPPLELDPAAKAVADDLGRLNNHGFEGG